MPPTTKISLLLLIVAQATCASFAIELSGLLALPATGDDNSRILQATRRLEEVYKQHSVSFQERSPESNIDVLAIPPSRETNESSSSSSSSSSTNDDENNIAICNLIDLNNYNGGSPRGPFLTFSLQSMATINLAVEHLNTGDGSIIQEVQDLDKRCPIRFTTEHVDTEGSPKDAVDKLMHLLQRQQQSQSQPQPCAFLGAFRSSVSAATALYTSLRSYPQISAVSAAVELDDTTTFPYFGRMIPPAASYGSILIEYLVEVLGVTHLAAIYSDDLSAVSYINGMRSKIQQDYPHFQMKAINFNTVTVTGTIASDYQTSVVKALRDTGYRYIYCSVGADHTLDILQEAHEMGIVGVPDYTWIFTSINQVDGLLVLDEQPNGHHPTSDLVKIGTGMLSLDIARPGDLPDGFPLYDAFMEQWSELGQSPLDLDYLQTKIPSDLLQLGENTPQISNETFAFRAFGGALAAIYDAVIALGLAACDAAVVIQQEDTTDTNSTTTSTKMTLSGPDHYEHMLNSSHVGTTGPINLDPKTGSRTPRSVFYQITNFVPHHNDDTGNITFQQVKTHFFQGDNWTQVHPIAFSDNTTNIPKDLPNQQLDYNYVGVGLRVAGLLMSVIVILTSVALGFWTYQQRDERIVKASQPIFLYIILCGVFLMGASIIPKSIDDEIVSNDAADVACSIFPWFLALGWCFSFSALYSKTRRVNKIFHNPSFKRVKIEPKDVMKPMLSLVACNVIILSLWTALDPLRWEREVVDTDEFGRPSESQGQCISEDWLPYLLALGIVNLGALVVAMHQAWIARKIALEFAESKWIARVMNTILVVSFIGLPVLVISKEDPRAFYFVFTALIFVICMSLMGFIFGPKIIMHRTRQGERGGGVRGSALKRTMQKIGGSHLPSGATAGSSRYSSGTVPNTSSGLVSNTSGIVSNSSGPDLDNSSNHVRPSTHEGARILEHPKTLQEREDEVRKLRQENQQLRREKETLHHLTMEMEAELVELKGTTNTGAETEAFSDTTDTGRRSAVVADKVINFQ